MIRVRRWVDDDLTVLERYSYLGVTEHHLSDSRGQQRGTWDADSAPRGESVSRKIDHSLLVVLCNDIDLDRVVRKNVFPVNEQRILLASNVEGNGSLRGEHSGFDLHA